MTHRVSLRLQPEVPAILPLAGPSRAMRELVRQIELLTKADRAPALLVGEPGTGKGWLAEYIHAGGARATFAFGMLNCATMDSARIRAELFGAPDDAETSAGMVGAARGGSICMEEISELPSEVQAMLFDLLQASASHSDDSADSLPVRIIAAGSKDLVNEVNAGRFREDLYYQLSVTPVHLPPLRARSREDLLELISAVVNSIASGFCGAPRELGDGVAERLIVYPWPGNIRELRNVLERSMLAARGETAVQRAHLPAELGEDGESDEHVPRTIAEVERAHIHRTLRAHKLNRTHAARELGISRATLIKKIKEYGLAVSGASSA